MISNYEIPIDIGETYELQLFKIKPNSNFEYEDSPTIIFKGRPATNIEKKQFRITKGVMGNNMGVSIFCSNLPKEVEPNDRISFLGKSYVVTNTGYYLSNAGINNARIFSEQYIKERSPKGLTLE